MKLTPECTPECDAEPRVECSHGNCARHCPVNREPFPIGWGRAGGKGMALREHATLADHMSYRGNAAMGDGPFNVAPPATPVPAVEHQGSAFEWHCPTCGQVSATKAAEVCERMGYVHVAAALRGVAGERRLRQSDPPGIPWEALDAELNQSVAALGQAGPVITFPAEKARVLAAARKVLESWEYARGWPHPVEMPAEFELCEATKALRELEPGGDR